MRESPDGKARIDCQLAQTLARRTARRTLTSPLGSHDSGTIFAGVHPQTASRARWSPKAATQPLGGPPRPGGARSAASRFAAAGVCHVLAFLRAAFLASIQIAF